jgi:hypothetical protein
MIQNVVLPSSFPPSLKVVKNQGAQIKNNRLSKPDRFFIDPIHQNAGHGAIPALISPP